MKLMCALGVAAILLLASSGAAARVELLPAKGDLEADQLAQIDEAVRIVVGEGDALEGEWTVVAQARAAGEQIDVIVTLAPQSTREPVVVERVVSQASILAQTRAMVREVFGRALERARPTPSPMIEKTSLAAAPAPPAEHRHDRTTALVLSFVPMVALITTGTVLYAGWHTWSDWDSRYLISGAVIGISGVLLGPLPGYLYLHRSQWAWSMFGLRLALVLTTAGFAGLMAYTACDDTDEPCSDSGGFEVSALLMTMSYTAAGTIAVIDASLAGRAADQANARLEGKGAAFFVAPIVWRGPRGDAAPGMVFSAAF